MLLPDPLLKELLGPWPLFWPGKLKRTIWPLILLFHYILGGNMYFIFAFLMFILYLQWIGQPVPGGSGWRGHAGAADSEERRSPYGRLFQV